MQNVEQTKVAGYAFLSSVLNVTKFANEERYCSFEVRDGGQVLEIFINCECLYNYRQ